MCDRLRHLQAGTWGCGCCCIVWDTAPTWWLLHAATFSRKRHELMHLHAGKLCAASWLPAMQPALQSFESAHFVPCAYKVDKKHTDLRLP